MSTLQTVDFVVSGLEERGQPGSSFVEVAEVGVLDEHGMILRRVRTAEALIEFLQEANGEFQLVATETVGPARSDLIGKFWCQSRATAGENSEGTPCAACHSYGQSQRAGAR